MTGKPVCTMANGQAATENALRYEVLRSSVLENCVPLLRHGLAVLLGQGLSAWMAAWAKVPAPPPPRSVKDNHCEPSSLQVESGMAVVHVLTAMTLGHLSEVHA